MCAPATGYVPVTETLKKEKEDYTAGRQWSLAVVRLYLPVFIFPKVHGFLYCVLGLPIHDAEL